MAEISVSFKLHYCGKCGCVFLVPEYMQKPACPSCTKERVNLLEDQVAFYSNESKIYKEQADSYKTSALHFEGLCKDLEKQKGGITMCYQMAMSENNDLAKSNAALKGVITKLRKKLRLYGN